ncbi:unnamed protein product [Leptidea sinapis]|uniref:Uncharacterized protein n=1 Tax=Leptidea sinapis TaxID=189913 RepID=A0A5E4PYW5_9NEOP|nr:unnamed protein product [Leptidea sinapis]
MAGINSIME